MKKKRGFRVLGAALVDVFSLIVGFPLWFLLLIEILKTFGLYNSKIYDPNSLENIIRKRFKKDAKEVKQEILELQGKEDEDDLLSNEENEQLIKNDNKNIKNDNIINNNIIKCILNMKSKETIDSLWQDIPSELTELLRYVKSLQFDTKPLYNKFYYSFQYLISKLNSEQTEEKNYNYMWEKKLVDWITRDEEEKYNGGLREIQNRTFKGYPVDLKKFANYIIYNNKI